jgi:predicted nucleic acid-binding Zn ribbon protein
MFCDQCGTHLQPGQQSCPRCAKPVLGPVAYRRNRVQEHVRLLGILWMAYSALLVVGGVLLVAVARTIFGGFMRFPNGPPPEINVWLRPLLTLIGGVILGKAAAGFVAGWGLLQRESWARVVTLVVGFLTLFNIPLGTALGIYTLWVLLPTQSDDEYQALAKAA